MSILTTYRNDDDGTEAVIAEHDSGGFSVTLRDLDSGEYLPIAKIYRDRERAEAWARSLVAAVDDDEEPNERTSCGNLVGNC